MFPSITSINSFSFFSIRITFPMYAPFLLLQELVEGIKEQQLVLDDLAAVKEI